MSGGLGAWLGLLGLGIGGAMRRPWRMALSAGGVALGVCAYVALASLSEGYRRSLFEEVSRSGTHLMLVPLGCPYDAAVRVLKGRPLEHSIPERVARQVGADPDVEVAAPLLVLAIGREAERRHEVWVGINEAALRLKPWWGAERGEAGLPGPGEVVLGAETAEVEARETGDRFHSPEMGQTFRVAGVLGRSGTADDSVVFARLGTLQGLTGNDGRITAVGVRLRDPSRMRDVVGRLQALPGAQVVTLTEMMGTFLNLVGTVRAMMLALVAVACGAGLLGMFNTILASVVERTGELALLRAMGASRGQVFAVVLVEAAWMGAVGGVAGVTGAGLGGSWLEGMARELVPFAPSGAFMRLDAGTAMVALGLAPAAGMLAAVLPALRASGIPPGQAGGVR